MAFETFNPAKARQRSGIEKRVTVAKTGQIALNSTCTRTHFENVKYIVLMYDRESGKIAIKPTTEADDNACKLSFTKSGSAYISGRGFLAFCDIPYKKTTPYPAEWDETLGAVVFQPDKQQ